MSECTVSDTVCVIPDGFPVAASCDLHGPHTGAHSVQPQAIIFVHHVFFLDLASIIEIFP